MARAEVLAMRRRGWAVLAGAAVGAALVLGSDSVRAEDEAPTLDCVIEPSMLVSVGSQADGVLENVLVGRGDVVERGQLLATLDDELERAAEALYRARASTDVSVRWSDVKASYGARSAERLRKLGAASAVSEQDVDEAVTDERLARLKSEEAKVNRRLAQLEHRRAQAALGQREIKSPVRAVVVERLMHPGERVTDEPIMTLAAIDTLNVEVIAPIGMFGKVAIGTRARVTPEQPVGGEYTATVSVVDKVMDARSGTFGVRLSLPNTDHALPAGLRCKISFDFDATPVRASAPAAPSAPAVTAVDTSDEATTDSEAIAEAPASTSDERQTSQPEQRPTAQASSALSTVNDSLASRILASAIPSAEAASPPVAAATTAPPVPASPEKEVKIAPGACVEFGPFSDAAQARAVSRLMSERGNENVVRETVNGRLEGYLLLVPITGSAKAMVADLARKGVLDVQVMRRGPHAGHISVGYHKRREHAEKHLAKLEKHGIAVRLTERRSGRRSFWVGFDAPRAKSRTDLSRRLRALEPDSSMRDVPCIDLRQAAL